MNKSIQHIVWFVGLVILQISLFNNIKLLNYFNPYIYILFIIYYPLKREKGLFLIISFLLGLSIDIFSDSGGINAAATVFIAYFRLPILSTILKRSDFDFLLFNLRSISFSKAFSYVFSLTFIHHLILYSLDYFSFNKFGTIISKTILTTIFSMFVMFIGIVLFTKRK